MYHHQNLNERGHGKMGTILKHGRAWWGRLNWEWHFGLHSPAMYVRKGDGGGLHLHLAFLLFSFFVTLGGLFRPSQRDREISIRCMDGSIWFRFWGDPDDSKYDHQWLFRWKRLLIGKPEYSRETLEEREAVIPMPEGAYPCTVKIEIARWKYPRWFTRSVTCADVQIPKGIPHQGKGENSWDCDDDATYGVYCPSNSVEEAIGKVVAGALKDRRRYGSTAATRNKVVLAA